jgi:hypothetical protein
MAQASLVMILLTGSQMLFNKLGSLFQRNTLHFKFHLMKSQTEWEKWILSNLEYFLKRQMLLKGLI